MEISRPSFFVVRSKTVAKKIFTNTSQTGSIWYEYHRDRTYENNWEIFGNPKGPAPDVWEPEGHGEGHTMNDREKEHYKIAGEFKGREFTRSEFKNHYRQEYPNRKPGSMLPADYCINPVGGRHAKGTENYPKFLRWLGRGRYQMIKNAKVT